MSSEPLASYDKSPPEENLIFENTYLEDCPTEVIPIFSDEMVCNGSLINVPTDEMILENVDNPINAFVVWDGDVTAPVFNPGGTCDIIVIEFHYSIHCTTDPVVIFEGGTHTVEVWPEIQPPVVTVDEFCNYGLATFCPTDIVDPPEVDPSIPVQEFTVINPFGCTEVFMVEIPDCLPPVEVGEITIIPVCHEYLVTFDIFGGTGNYVINGVPLPPGQSNFISDPIFCEIPYFFDVTDDVNSSFVVVDGPGPVCPPPLEVAPPTIEIIGNQYQVTFIISGGTGDYAVNGMAIAGNIFTSDFIDCGLHYEFFVSDNCSELPVSGGPVNCYDPIEIFNLQITQECDEYLVTFDIQGGTGNYVVNGIDLPPGQTNYTSTTLTCADPYNFLITDDVISDNVQVQDNGPDCLPPVEISAPVYNITGGSYQVTITISGGSGNYFVDGVPLVDNIFVSEPIVCGEPYFFLFSDECEETVTVEDVFTCYEPISVINLSIEQICNEYRVSFEIIGGTGNYVINGNPLPPGQSTVTSQLIPCGLGYTAEITDDLNTSVYDLIGEGPDCLPPLEVTAPLISVDASNYQVLFQITGGTGNYTVDGNPVSGTSFISDLIQCGQPFSFIVSDGCEDLTVSSEDPIYCYDPISITDLEVLQTCNEYIVSFTILGGSGNYVVNGSALPPGQSNVVSQPLPCGTNFFAEITDDVMTNIYELNGTGPECLPPLEIGPVITDVVGNQYKVSIIINGGTGSYTVNGNAISGNLFDSEFINCGQDFSFIVTDGCEELTVSGESPECFEPISIADVQVVPTCNVYHVFFTVSGGSGNYIVNGVALPPGQSDVVSLPLECGTNFNFEITDDFQSDQTVISGPGSDCLPPIIISEPIINISNQQYEVTVTISGGTGDYTVDGTPLPGNLFMSNPIPCGHPYSFELTDGCETVPISGPPIECYDPITVSEIETGLLCDQYTATFTASGGTGSYLVDGIPLEGNVYVSGLMDCGEPFAFELSDDLQTGQVTVAGDGPECPEPLGTSPVLTGVLDNQYTAQFTPTGGTGNYQVDGIPLEGGLYVSGPIPCGEGFEFELYDGCETLPVFGGPVECYDPIIASEITIGPICDQYTAQFTLSGGTGEYNVDGLPIEGNTFISPYLDCGEPFIFIATDNLQTDQVTVAGDGPDCPDPLTNSEVLTGVIGNQYTATFTPSGGSGNYAVDGIPLEGPTYVSSPIPCGEPFSFDLTDNCETVIVNGGPIDCFDPITVSEILVGSNCNQYTTQFTVSGGTGNYLVDGLPVEGNFFISPYLDCGQPFTFEVTDDSQTNPVIVTGDGAECPDPLATSAVLTGVIGNQYTATFTPSGGSGNYAVDGIPLEGPTYVSSPIPCGEPFSFDLTDNCETVIVNGGPIDCFDPITVSEILIGSNCNQYTTQFTMSGGTGNYLVDGLPVEGNFFISPYLDCGQPFTFEVTDDSQTNPVIVTGDGAECPDPLATSAVLTGVIGNQYTATFTPSGGSGNYAVDGIPLEVPTYVSSPIPCGEPFSFDLTDNCETVIVSGGPIDCFDPITISEIMTGSFCNQFTTQFTVSGGSGNYQVDGLPFEGNTFVSPYLDCGEPYTFEVTDDSQTNPVIVTGDGAECPDPLEVSEVMTGIIGNQYTAQFTPSGGTGDYAVNGIPLEDNTYISPAIPCGEPYAFTITDECEEELSVAGDPPCLACPSVVGDFSEMGYYCDGDTPVFPTEEAILATLDIASGEVFDFPVAEPLYYTGDGCTPQQFEFDFQVRCILDPTVILPAGTMTVMLYPEPQPPFIIQVDSTETGCIYEVVPNCPGDIVEPSELDEVPAGTTGLTQTFEVYNEGCSAGLLVDVAIPDCIIDKVTDPQTAGDLSMQLHNNPMSIYEAIILIDVGEKTEGLLQIWDVNGRLVRTISHQVFTPGSYTFYWDGNTDKGDIAPSGIYAVELQTDIGRRVAKLVKLY